MRIRRLALAVAVLLGGAQAIAQCPASGSAGDVLIDTKGSVALVLVATGGQDGLVDQWFRLESETPLQPISEHIVGAEIVRSEGHLRVISREWRVVYDFVISGTNPLLLPPAGFLSVRVEGHRITHTTRPTTIRIRDVRRNRATAFDCEGCDYFNSTTSSSTPIP